MRQSDITPEVIRLSKEIAKYWRMEMYEGCWVRVANKIRMVIGIQEDFYYTQDSFNWGHPQWTIKAGFPIPSISDCLEKLRELGYAEYGITTFSPYDTEHEVELWKGNSTLKFRGSTLHETLLSALLEVLSKNTQGGE